MILGRLPGCAFYESLTCLFTYENDACLLLGNSTVLAAFFLRYNLSNRVPCLVPNFWVQFNQSPYAIGTVQHLSIQTIIPVPSFEVSS